MVRAPAQVASNSDDIVECVGIILWTMAQSHRITMSLLYIVGEIIL